MTRSTSLDAEAGSRVVSPAKFAVSVYSPAAAVGVTVQEATTAGFVTALHCWLATSNMTLAPTIGAAGVTDESRSAALSCRGEFGAPPPGLELRLRKLVCFPGVQPTVARFDDKVDALTVADALSWS